MGALMAAPLLLRIADREFRVEVHDESVVVDGVAVEAAPRAWAVADGDARWVFNEGEVYEFEVQRPGKRRDAAHGTLTAPMPATVRKIAVAEGAKVRKGDTLLVLEAMKMELPVRAPSDGVVSKITCREGELVQPGITLVEFE